MHSRDERVLLILLADSRHDFYFLLIHGSVRQHRLHRDSLDGAMKCRMDLLPFGLRFQRQNVWPVRATASLALDVLTEEIKRDVRHAPEMARMRQASTSAMSPDDLARSVFDAIQQERLYVLPHPWVKHAVQERTKDIIAERNPAPPPSVGRNGR